MITVFVLLAIINAVIATSLTVTETYVQTGTTSADGWVDIDYHSRKRITTYYFHLS